MTTLRTPRYPPTGGALWPPSLQRPRYEYALSDTSHTSVVEETIDLCGGDSARAESSGFSLQAWLSEAREAAAQNGSAEGDAEAARASSELRIGGYRSRPASEAPTRAAVDARKLALLRRRDKTPPATPGRDNCTELTEGEVAMGKLAEQQLVAVAARADRLSKLDLSSQRSPPMESPSMPSPFQPAVSQQPPRPPMPAPSVAEQLQALQMDQGLLNEITTLKLELLQARTKLSTVQRQLEHEQALRQRTEAALAHANASAAAAAARYNKQLKARSQLPPVLVSPAKHRQQTAAAVSASTQTERINTAATATAPMTGELGGMLHSSRSSSLVGSSRVAAAWTWRSCSRRTGCCSTAARARSAVLRY
eukprot:COSAG03_NODE_684_length_6315_cov_10.272040_3_plen_366_part_00